MDHSMRRKLLSLQPETARYMQIARPTQADIVALDQNIKAIKFGSGITLASVTANVSNVTDYYFLSNPSVDLRPYTGFYATITDTGSKTKKVLLGAVGTGETLGDDILIDGNFTTSSKWYGADGWSVNEATGKAERSGGTMIGQSIYHVADINYTQGQLYKGAITIDTVASGGISISMSTGSTSFMSYKSIAGTYYGYRTSSITSGKATLTAQNAATTATCDVFTIKQVLTPPATGTWYTPVSEDSGWNPNSASFTVTITRS